MMPVVELYCDGGVVLKNPSPYGGTWAWVAVDENGEVVKEDSGFVPAPEGRPVSNNHTEQIAIIKGLEAMEPGWSGTVLSDSMIALGRVFQSWRTKNLPDNIIKRTREALMRVGNPKTVLLKGHPTKKELERGTHTKRFKTYEKGPKIVWKDIEIPVSIHNVRCDELCGLEAWKVKERLMYE